MRRFALSTGPRSRRVAELLLPYFVFSHGCFCRFDFQRCAFSTGFVLAGKWAAHVGRTSVARCLVVFFAHTGCLLHCRGIIMNLFIASYTLYGCFCPPSFVQRMALRIVGIYLFRALFYSCIALETEPEFFFFSRSFPVVRGTGFFV